MARVPRAAAPPGYDGLNPYVKGNNNVNVTVKGDGIVSDANGGGDSNPSTLTSTYDIKPEVAVRIMPPTHHNVPCMSQ